VTFNAACSSMMNQSQITTPFVLAFGCLARPCTRAAMNDSVMLNLKAACQLRLTTKAFKNLTRSLVLKVCYLTGNFFTGVMQPTKKSTNIVFLHIYLFVFCDIKI
jgi:hypothetical protein